MEVPAPDAGVVKEIKIKVGDKVSEGTLLLLMLMTAEPRPPPAAAPAAQPARTARRKRRPAACCSSAAGRCSASAIAAAPAATRSRGALEPIDEAKMKPVHAGPSVRRFARELGVDLSQSNRQRPERPHPAGRRAGLRQGASSRARAAPAAAGCGIQSAADAAGRFCKFGPVRNAAVVAHQEIVGREPASQLGSDSARDAARRSRHHRARGIPQVAVLSSQEGRHPLHAARVPDQGRGGRTQAISELQFVAVARRRESGAEAVFPYRRGGRYAAMGW